MAGSSYDVVGEARATLLVFRGPCDKAEEVVPMNVSTWVLLSGVTVGR
jgi:hypothetical protein